MRALFVSVSAGKAEKTTKMIFLYHESSLEFVAAFKRSSLLFCFCGCWLVSFLLLTVLQSPTASKIR